MMPAKSVGPYTGVSVDFKRRFRVQNRSQSFRIVLYGAYNALGLIGSECNGIAILAEQERQVVTDEICRQSSGFYGPSKDQLDCIDILRKLNWAGFKNLVNQSPRRRWDLTDAGLSTP